jgi:hypothetical protein
MTTILIETHPTPAGGFQTTPPFWECNCEDAYIHPVSQANCPACNTTRDDAPDARVHEVQRHADEWGLDHLTIVQFLRELTAEPIPCAGVR